MRLTSETWDQLTYLVEGTVHSPFGKFSRADVLCDLINRAYRRAKGMPSPEMEKYLQLGARSGRAETKATRAYRVVGANEPGTGKSLRTFDAARLLARLLGVHDVDDDRFLVLARRAGVEGKRERYGHLFWSENDVRRIAQATGAGGQER